MALTRKQHMFLTAYLETCNASEAARRAGYQGKRPDQAGYDYLRKPEIKAAIDEHITHIFPRGEVLERLAAHARGDFADFVTIGEEDIIVERRQRGDILETITARRTVARPDLEKAAQ